MEAVQLYTVTAHVDGNGIVLEEVFTNEDAALAFEDRVKEVLRKTYCDAMADHPSLEVTYAIRKLHDGALVDDNLYNGGWCEDRGGLDYDLEKD